VGAAVAGTDALGGRGLSAPHARRLSNSTAAAPGTPFPAEFPVPAARQGRITDFRSFPVGFRTMNPPAGIAKIARATVTEVEDVQAHVDTRRLPINRVGIKDISHPVRLKDRAAGEQHTIATFNMYVSLPHNFKGTHMSRFVEILHTEREISVESFRSMLRTMTERLEAETGHI